MHAHEILEIEIDIDLATTIHVLERQLASYTLASAFACTLVYVDDRAR